MISIGSQLHWKKDILLIWQTMHKSW